MTRQRKPRVERACQHDGCGRRPAVTLAAPTGGTDTICARHRDQYERAGWTVLPAGRRPSAAGARTVQIQVRATPAEVEQLEQAASRSGQPLATWVREAALAIVGWPPASSSETDG